MCGVFGFVSAGRPLNVDLLEQVALDTENRGRDAHGLAWINRDGRLRHFKSPGPVSRNLGCLSLAYDARMLIGHCRLSTHGSHRDQINNHPHPCDGGWLVHNGVVSNNSELIDRWELTPNSQCDSETIAQLIETIDGDTLLDRAASTANQLAGPAVVLGLWTRPARMLIVRRGRPLHVVRDDDGSIYFASLPAALHDPDRFQDNTARIIEMRCGGVVQTVRGIKPARHSERDPYLGRANRRYAHDLTASRTPYWS